MGSKLLLHLKQGFFSITSTEGNGKNPKSGKIRNPDFSFWA
jgi:hypothetical protein